MIVVADTSPINYLILIGSVDVLPSLYGEILSPPAVIRELSADASPPAVRAFIADPPQWFSSRDSVAPLDPSGALDDGEQEAIHLAREIGADLLLMDDAAGRSAASVFGLRVVGVVGVLVAGGRRNLLDFEAAFSALEGTSFFVSDRVKREAFRLWRHGNDRKS
ncbi:MAG: hypothetical protein R2748_32055 [Bryobacterales bacterium]